MNIVKKLPVVCLLVLVSGISHAHNAAHNAKKMFKEVASLDSVPGISAAYADINGIKWAKGFGYADIEKKVKMKANTKLRIGSIAKVITAAGLMRMYEQGSINFTSDIRELIHEWPEKHAAINLSHLVSHTSGIRHYISYAEFFSNVEYTSSIDALSIFSDDELLFTPGSDFGYSTFGWTLVSAVMERADNNRNFKNIIREEVLAPLEMDNTDFDDNAPIITNRQSSYSYYDEQLQNSPEVNQSYKYAGGGFLSTPSDVVKFAMAHVRDGYLNEHSLNMLFSKSELGDGTQVDAGIGWFIGFSTELKQAKEDAEANQELIRILNEHPISVSHSGGSVGGSSMMILCLDHKHAVAVAKNVDGDPQADVFELALKTLDIFHHNKRR